MGSNPQPDNAATLMAILQLMVVAPEVRFITLLALPVKSIVALAGSMGKSIEGTGKRIYPTS